MASFDSQLLRLLLNGICNEKEKSIIKEKNLYDTVDESNNTLLHHTAKWNNIAITQYLIDLGSPINGKNNDGNTPLFLAVRNNCTETIKILIHAGADIYAENNLGSSALKVFRNIGCVDKDVVRMFFETIKRNSKNIQQIANRLLESEWPLHYIVSLRNKDLTELVLVGEQTSTIGKCNRLGDTPLHIAVNDADVENVKILLEYNADVNAVDSDNRTPLFYALHVGDNSQNSTDRLEILKLLLEQVNDLKYTEDKTWLHLISDTLKNGNRRAIQCLLQIDLYLSWVLENKGCGDTFVSQEIFGI